MKFQTCLTTCALTFTSLLGLGFADLRAQGSLLPPGLPAPTMKTLDQVEARMVVNAANCPGDGTSMFIISAPGSYYLTANITLYTGNAINITAAGVTLDLNGFTIASTSIPAGDAIVSGTGQDLLIRNGHITGTGTYSGGNHGTFGGGGFTNGIDITAGRNCKVENVSVTGVRGQGINVAAGNAMISRCLVDTTDGTGINASSTTASVDHCSAQNCGGGGGILAQTVETCSAYAVGTNSTGINATTVANSTAFGYRGGIFATKTAENSVGTSYGPNPGVSALNATNCSGISSTGRGLSGITCTNCYGYSVDDYGINASEANGCDGNSVHASGLASTVANNCTGASTDLIGLFVSTAVNCYGTSTAGTGLQASAATNCYASSNGGTGLDASNAINCQGMSNSGYGINATTATNCVASSQSSFALSAVNASNCVASTTGTTASAVALTVSGTAQTCNCTGNGGGSYALKAKIAIGCTVSTGLTSITNKYNMP